MRAIYSLVHIAAFVAGSTAVWAQAGYTIQTVAGSDWVGDGGLATSAILIQSQGITTDGSGNLYIADAADQRVRKVSANGVITTIAGTGVAGFSGDGGPAAQAQLNSPYGLALDRQGNLYIADLGNSRVRCVSTDGNITTVAGGGSLPAGGANNGSPASMLALNAPRNLAFDFSGNLYISDFNAARVYVMNTQGSLTTVAGTGAAGAGGDNGPAIDAQLNYPAGLAFDPQGNLYIADSGNHEVRRISLGIITSYARADTPTGLAFDPTGTLYVADISTGVISVFPVSGSLSSIGVDALDVWFSSGLGLYASTGPQVVSAGGPVPVTLAGGGNLAHGDNGLAVQARLNHPAGTAADAAGNIYIADRDNHRIRRVSPDGTIVTIAGTGVPGYSGDGGPAASAQLFSPNSVSVDAAGNIYIADTGNATIRKIAPSGIITSVTNLGLVSPVYVISDPSSGLLYIADEGAGKILTVDSSGVPATILSGLISARGLALDAQGNLYYTDAGGSGVASLTAGGAVIGIGTGWDVPRGVAVDSSGNVYVADTGLQQILEVSPTQTTTVIAGTGTAGLSGDGGPAANAQLGFPWDVATTSSGALLVADLANNRIRELTLSSPQPAQTQVTPPAPISSGVTVVNAASLTAGPIAPGMLLSIGGTGITPAQIPNTVVAFGSNPGRILSADFSSMLVLVPTAIAGMGSVPIEILYQNTVVANVLATVANEAPALFADPSGQAAANNQDGSLNSKASPAARGSVISLFGTGLGVSGDPVTVTFGNYSAQVLYAGPVGNFPGLFQINVQVPSGYLPTGDLPLTVTIGNSSTQAGVLIWVD